jgi:penicillin-binding protein-related factor A (putative recombinase)
MKKRLAGKLAQSRGKSFETLFQETCKIQGIAVTPIPNGCRNVGRRIVRVKSPFDWVLGYNKRAAFIDTKTSGDKNFNHSKIKPHQLKALQNLSSSGVAGYVLKINGKIYFVDVSILAETKKGESVKLDYAVLLGSDFSFDARKIFR